MSITKPETVSAYLDSVPEVARPVLKRLRALVAAAAPAEAVEVLSYGIPTLDLLGKHLVHCAGYGGHVGLYPGADGIAAFQQELAGYKSAKGSVQFPLDAPLPEDLIRRIVEYRVAAVRKPPSKAGRRG